MAQAASGKVEMQESTVKQVSFSWIDFTLALRGSMRRGHFVRCLIGETELKLLYRAWPRRGEISFSTNSLKTISGTKCQGEHVIRNLLLPCLWKAWSPGTGHLMNLSENQYHCLQKERLREKRSPHPQNLNFKFNFIKGSGIWSF